MDIVYTKGIKKYLGASFDNYLIISSKGYSAGYALEKEIINFGKNLASKIKKDRKKGAFWVKNLKEQTDYIKKLLKGIYKEKKLTADHYYSVLEAMENYVAWHAAIKFSGDYLSLNGRKKLLVEFSKVRNYSENIYIEVEDFFRRYLTSISSKIAVPLSLVEEFSVMDIERYRRGKKLPSKETLKSRYDKAALIFKQGKYRIIKGNKARIFKKSIIGDTFIKILKGHMAFQGVAKGRVKIILDPKRESIKEGEILVTGMTRTEYLPHIKRSAAFVTDAGGTLSHAAITARELKKPCIVGTKIATKVLKDGDLVEVDADKGVVKIINGKK